MSQRKACTMYAVSTRGTLHARKFVHWCGNRRGSHCSCSFGRYAICGQAIWNSRWQYSRKFCDRPVLKICSRCNRDGTIEMPTQEFTFGVAISNPSPRWKPVLHRTLRDAPLCGSGSYIRSLNPQLVEAAIAEAGNFPYCKNCERIAESFKGRLYRQLFQTS